MPERTMRVVKSFDALPPGLTTLDGDLVSLRLLEYKHRRMEGLIENLRRLQTFPNDSDPDKRWIQAEELEYLLKEFS